MKEEVKIFSLIKAAEIELCLSIVNFQATQSSGKRLFTLCKIFWNKVYFTKFSLRSPAMRVKFSQTYKKNNGFIWGRLFSSSSLSSKSLFIKKLYSTSSPFYLELFTF